MAQAMGPKWLKEENIEIIVKDSLNDCDTKKYTFEAAKLNY